MKQLTNPRELRGLAILSQPDTVSQVSKNGWNVKSQSGAGFYQVNRKFYRDRDSRFEWACTCPDHTSRHVVCKHIYAVQFSLKLKTEIEERSAIQLIAEANQKIICPICKSESVAKWGNRKTKYGTIQRYACHVCNHTFVVDKGFCRMKHNPKIVTLALDLYFKGISQRKIVDHIKQFYDTVVTQPTILRWIRKYLKLLARYAEKYKAEVGNIWHSDETTVFIKKEGEKRYYEWVWNIMDAKTRYLLACQVTQERNVKDAIKPLRKAKEVATKRPDAIVTDGLHAYNAAIKAEFYDVNAQIQNPHLRLKDFETQPNNNILERLNGTLRERTKVLRSLDSVFGAQEFVTGMQVYYNYIRPHQGIGGLTPAQMAKIPIDLMGNRWERMIGLAAK